MPNTRSPSDNSSSSQPRRSFRRSFGGLALLLALFGGGALVFFLLFGERLRSRIPVDVAPVLLLAVSPEDALAPPAEPLAEPPPATQLLAQASGWIEPDPYPLRATAETDGFVETVHALEGQFVSRGDLVATLDPTNHLLRVQALEARLQEVKAEWQTLLHEQAASSAAVDQARSALPATAARLQEATDRQERLTQLTPEDVTPLERLAAETAAAEAEAAHIAARARLRQAHSTFHAKAAQLDRISARIDAVTADLSLARQDLARTRIYAPADGVVLQRFAEPGRPRMAGMDAPESATILTLYQPEHLQIRVDVPLADVSLLRPGMPARIYTAAVPDQTLTGRLTRIVGQADRARNTLQVKVAIENPLPILRPEMLCRVEFLGAAPGRTGHARSGDGESTQPGALWVPVEALQHPDPERGSATVWVVDPIRHTASPRTIQTTRQQRDGYQRVRGGLRPGERVVLRGTHRLAPGILVHPIDGDTP